MKIKKIILILFVLLSFVFGMKDLQGGYSGSGSFGASGATGLFGWLGLGGLAGSAADPIEQVSEQVSATGSVRRTDYVDADGNLVFNTKKNYASMVQELDADGHAVREFYYDENGAPAKQYAGHYGVAREWQDGRNVLVTYLTAAGEPFINDYNYASQRQSFYEDGKTHVVMYLGLVGEQVLDRNGEYGIEYEYDERGWTSRITSLDSSGQPMKNGEGYVYVDRTFYDDGELRTLRYYQADGTPAAIGKGVYGTENVGSRQFSLGADGQRVFRINDFLNNDPWIVFAVGLCLALTAVMLPGTFLKAAFLTVYVLFILYETVFTRESGSASGNLTPFWSYRLFFSSYQQRIGILDNIWLFVPLGAAVGGGAGAGAKGVDAPAGGQSVWDDRLERRYRIGCILFLILFSCGIELVQRIFGLGFCEFDDVFSNTIGGILGIWIADVLRGRVKGRFSDTLGEAKCVGEPSLDTPPRHTPPPWHE